jgi:hypothetical protein
MGLGEAELLDMAGEQHGADLVCHFCNRNIILPRRPENDRIRREGFPNARKDAHE